MPTEIHTGHGSSVIITYLKEGDWGRREHSATPDCWCKPTQDEEEPSVWVHNDPWQSEEGKPKQ